MWRAEHPSVRILHLSPPYIAMKGELYARTEVGPLMVALAV